jgi:hypothetical protein
MSVTFSDTKADMTPVALPDLYRGEPLVLAAKLGRLAGTMEIKGRIGDRPWSVTLPLANAAEGRSLRPVCLCVPMACGKIENIGTFYLSRAYAHPMKPLQRGARRGARNAAEDRDPHWAEAFTG